MATREELLLQLKPLENEWAGLAHKVYKSLQRPFDQNDLQRLIADGSKALNRMAELEVEMKRLGNEIRAQLRVGETLCGRFYRLHDKVFAEVPGERKKWLVEKISKEGMVLYTELWWNMDTLTDEPDNELAYILCVSQLRKIHSFHLAKGHFVKPFPED